MMLAQVQALDQCGALLIGCWIWSYCFKKQLVRPIIWALLIAKWRSVSRQWGAVRQGVFPVFKKGKPPPTEGCNFSIWRIIGRVSLARTTAAYPLVSKRIPSNHPQFPAQTCFIGEVGLNYSVNSKGWPDGKWYICSCTFMTLAGHDCSHGLKTATIILPRKKSSCSYMKNAIFYKRHTYK